MMLMEEQQLHQKHFITQDIKLHYLLIQQSEKDIHFWGWSKEKDGNLLTEYRMKSDSITLYAQWIKNSNY